MTDTIDTDGQATLFEEAGVGADPEREFSERLDTLVSKLQAKYRPTHLEDLRYLLETCFLWPGPDPVFCIANAYDRQVEIDKTLRSFQGISRRLQRLVQPSDGYYSLLSDMGERLPSGDAGDSAAAYFIELEGLLPKLTQPLNLLARPAKERPPHVKDGYVRDLVRCVLWYLKKIEGYQPTTSGYGGSSVTGRAGIICQLAIDALQVPVSSSLHSQIRSVMREAGWQNESYDWWDNLPKHARPTVPKP
jgi:hypothetical protein